MNVQVYLAAIEYILTNNLCNQIINIYYAAILTDPLEAANMTGADKEVKKPTHTNQLLYSHTVLSAESLRISVQKFRDFLLLFSFVFIEVFFNLKAF